MASLLLACLIHSPRKPFWSDEVYSWTFISDPSLRHMLRALWSGAETAPPLHHLVARVWAVPFGTSPLSLRMLSCVAICAALLLLWNTLRRHYAYVPTALGVLGILTGRLLAQSNEARFYGVYFLMAALGVHFFDRLTSVERPRPRSLVANALAHAGLVFTHVFGLVYSGAILAALIISDAVRRRFRPAVYSSLLAAWLPILFWLPVLNRAAELGKPHGWIQVPTLETMFTTFDVETFWLATIVIAALALTTIPIGLSAPPTMRPRTSDTATAPLLLCAVGILAVMPLIFVVSRIALPVFVDRYMLPNSLGMAIVIAHLTHALGADTLASRDPTAKRRQLAAMRAGWMMLILTLLIYPLWWAQAAGGTRPAVLLPRGLDPDTPLVTENSLDLLELLFQRPESPLYFALDWASATDPASPPAAVTNYNAMKRFRENGYYTTHLVESDAFLARTPRFYLLARDNHCLFNTRLKQNPAFRWQLVRRMPNGTRVLEITKVNPDVKYTSWRVPCAEADSSASTRR